MLAVCVAGDLERSRDRMKSKLDAPGRGGVGGSVDLGVLTKDDLSGVGGCSLYSPDVLLDDTKPGDLRGAERLAKAWINEC